MKRPDPANFAPDPEDMPLYTPPPRLTKYNVAPGVWHALEVLELLATEHLLDHGESIALRNPDGDISRGLMGRPGPGYWLLQHARAHLVEEYGHPYPYKRAVVA